MKYRKNLDIDYNTAITIPQAVPFDGIEIHPVLSHKEGNLICFEVCEPDKAENWSVYLHQTEGGLSCIADCKDQPTAIQLAYLIKIIVENWTARNMRNISCGR
jgi:hypothetical protein